MVFTVFRGHGAWTDVKERRFEAASYFRYTLQTTWYQSEAARLLWHLVSQLWEETKRAVHGHTAATRTSLVFLSAGFCYNFQSFSRNQFKKIEETGPAPD